MHGGPVAELTHAIEPPASHCARSQAGAAIAIARFDLCDACEPDDGDWARTLRVRPVPELPKVVVAPATDGAVVQTSTCVGVASGHLSDSRKAHDLYRRGAVSCRAVTKCA